MIRTHTQKGFTLLETLLYVAVASTILLTSTVFAATLVESRVKNQTVAEVEQQGYAIMQRITQTIRNAESVMSPTAGNSGVSLILDVVDAGLDPIVFDLQLGVVESAEGSGSALALTNERVVVSDLLFENLSRADTPGVVRVSFTVRHLNPEGRNEYDFEKTFYGSATLRQP